MLNAEERQQLLDLGYSEEEADSKRLVFEKPGGFVPSHLKTF